jgi:hypothetical protein
MVMGALSLFSELSAETPSSLYLLAIIIFVFGMALMACYIAELNNKNGYKVSFSLGIVGIAIYLLYVIACGSIASQRNDKTLINFSKVK